MGGIAGLIAPKSEVEKLIDGIESGEINRLKSMNACFAAMHDNYYTYDGHGLTIRYRNFMA